MSSWMFRLPFLLVWRCLQINRRSKRGIFNQLGVVEHRIKDGLNSVEKSVMSRGAQISVSCL